MVILSPRMAPKHAALFSILLKGRKLPEMRVKWMNWTLRRKDPASSWFKTPSHRGPTGGKKCDHKDDEPLQGWISLPA